MKKKIFAAVISLVLLVLSSCNSNPLEAPVVPMTRDYVWSVDTILNYAYMNKLWGSSPRDVWAIGQPGIWSKSIWHFNGTNWSTDNVVRSFVPHSIYGFSVNNIIWIGGSSGKIWNNQSGYWKEAAVLTKDGHSDIVFDNMWGDSPNGFYAFGAYTDENLLYNNSVIAHYTGSNWDMQNTDGLQGIVERFYKNKPDEKFYVQTYKIGGGQYPDSTLIYEYIQGKYNKIYGSIWTQGLQADISLINGEVYFVLGNEIAKRVNNQFQTFLRVDNPNFYQRIWGRNSKDIFLLMTDGLAHYDGTDIEYLFHFNKPRTQIYIGGAALFDYEVFFLADEFSTGLYLKSLLTE
ncbi:MAG: hypothetical protein M1495_24625, partial [Bacteroidetes bacterium]|nr:hypothetical protein [Bacteroidota bacterium]